MATVSTVDGSGIQGGNSFEAEPAKRHYVLRFLGRRIGGAVATLLVASMLIFWGTQMLPGDVATAILGRDATPAALSSLRVRLNLYEPLYERYFVWLGGFVRGDLGTSATQSIVSGKGTSVVSLVSDRLVNTFILATVTTILMIPLGVGLGVWAGAHQRSLADHVISSASLGAVAVPEFVTGSILILVLAVWLRLFPAVSMMPVGGSVLSQPQLLVLPVATLLLAELALTIRMIRACMIEVLKTDYVAQARLDGIPERRVVYRYALRNALAPTVQVIALDIQWLVGGIVVTETVFGYPGIGQGLVQAVTSRDIPFVASVCMLIAVFYVSVNIVADLIVVFIVPKLRTAEM